MTPRIYSVSELNRLARQAIESQIPLLWVGGEVSNLVTAASGHVYFTLKDAGAAVRCVMFRSRAQVIGWRLANGDKVEANALASLYEARGDFQLNVEALRRAGSGNLYEQFLRLKARLEAEGLFDPARKRPLPRFPRRIGLVTSPQAAVLRDLVTTFRRRSPQVELVLYPSAVQGAGAPAELVAAINAASARATLDGCEILIVGRGGGSLEDLWAFNDEAVARAIRACAIPVIAAVGHETDFTIADFVADLRAPTPTAAAEQAAPERDRLLQRLDDLGFTLKGGVTRRIEQLGYRLEIARRRLKHPAERLREHRASAKALNERLRAALRHQLGERQFRLARLGERLARRRPDPAAHQLRLAHLQKNLGNAAWAELARRRSALGVLAARLQGLDPSAVLARGYSIVTDGSGRIVKNAESVELGSEIGVRLASGYLRARVEDREATKNKDFNSLT
ncbi:MAG TPA: exodeoxyribonuclease VII large subunit [Rhodocyclaceae bacterium]|nr:exodeoxyribonuclease VII large subunit [Rhodocyclaceae bacterium]